MGWLPCDGTLAHVLSGPCFFRKQPCLDEWKGSQDSQHQEKLRWSATLTLKKDLRGLAARTILSLCPAPTHSHKKPCFEIITMSLDEPGRSEKGNDSSAKKR